MIKTILLTAAVIVSNIFTFKANYQAPYELAHMDESDFIFLSSVVEAESDRSESLRGRILIAETILNRVNSPLFPDTISGVLQQNNQFSTVVNGRSIVERTELSDQAVIIAVNEIEAGEAPAVMFFNCIGFNSYGEPYGSEPIDGNYFMVYEYEEG